MFFLSHEADGFVNVGFLEVPFHSVKIVSEISKNIENVPLLIVVPLLSAPSTYSSKM
jgi:hypothetical protein